MKKTTLWIARFLLFVFGFVVVWVFLGEEEGEGGYVLIYGCSFLKHCWVFSFSFFHFIALTFDQLLQF